MIYYINLGITFIFLFFSRVVKIKKQYIFSKLLISYSFINIWLTSGLRYGVGTDFYSYLNHYQNAWNIHIYENEPLYLFGVRILKLIFGEKSQMMFIITSFIILFLIFKISIKRVKYYELSIFLFITLYFYYSSLNLVRQWISISIVLYSYKYIFEKKKKKYLINVFLATMIHNTAIYSILFYYLFNLNMKKNINKIVVLLSIIISFKVDIITNSIFKFLSIINLGGYNNYLGYEHMRQGAGNAYFIISLLVFIFYLINYKKISNKDKQSKYNIKILFFIVLFAKAGASNMIFGRIQMYILPYIIYIIPELLVIFTKKRKIIIYYMIVVLGVIYMSRSLLINGGGVVPYKIVNF